MKYTTGEIAKLCGVTIRTVQYYDECGILVPSELSEGGRRLFSEEDLQKMKLICYLRSLNISIKNIKNLFREDNPEEVIFLLLDEQEKELDNELAERKDKLNKIKELKSNLKKVKHFSVESIIDMEQFVKNKKNLRKVRIIMLVLGLIMWAIEISTLLLWIFKGIWLPFVIGMVIVVIMGIWISWYYFKKVAYICPKCHEVFKPKFKDAFFAKHTPRTRKLTCPKCGHHGYCVETYAESNN